ncbi:MAG: TRAP transporter small permease subunit [Alphaproteobacteria bacterium]|nr:TRAP transporter small permease subunit [Alphaproteobacteria bacterium]
MSVSGDTGAIQQYGNPAIFVRIVGWSMLAMLAGFMINNALEVGFGFPNIAQVMAGSGGAFGALPVAIYLIGIFLAIRYVLKSRDTALRWDAQKIHAANVYIIRGFFFAVLFIGFADVTVAFLRVEKILDAYISLASIRDLERPSFVGTYIHIPLIILGFIVAAFTRTLGFMWLALLIVLAELTIVVTRFVFSYEQAFMGDLVRYWYSALFLLASAYTLHDEGHVRVDVVYAGLRARTKGLINAYGAIFLGMSTSWVILLVGFNGKQSIINSPVLNFEVTQTGSIGMFVKYQMAAFLGIFGATMLIQFVSMYFESVADYRNEPGHRAHEDVVQ